MGGEEEREKAEEFWSESIENAPPCAGNLATPFTCSHPPASPCLQTPGQGCSMEKKALKLGDEAAPTGMSRARQAEPRESKPGQWGGGRSSPRAGQVTERCSRLCPAA